MSTLGCPLPFSTNSDKAQFKHVDFITANVKQQKATDISHLTKGNQPTSRNVAEHMKNFTAREANDENQTKGIEFHFKELDKEHNITKNTLTNTKPFVALDTSCIQNSKTINEYDSEEERPYTDDDIDDFAEEEFLVEPKNCNSESPEGESYINMQFCDKKGAMLLHESRGDLDQTNSGAIYSEGTMKPTEEDFVLPPLPPPPTTDFLNTQLNQNVSPNQVGNGIKSYQSAKPAIWSPTSKSVEELPLPPPPNDNELISSPPPIQPFLNNRSKGFRPVVAPTGKKSSASANPQVQKTSSSFSIPGKPFTATPNANTTVTPSSKLPEGAVYQTMTQDGDHVHTDTYYPAAEDDNAQSVVLERTKKTTVFKAPHHVGIGPVNESGVPYALRSTVDDSKHWYKNMFKQMHKIEKEEDDDKFRPHSANDVLPVNDRTVPHHSSKDVEKPKKVGKITDYQPAMPYVVENKPQMKSSVPPTSTSYKPAVAKSEAVVETGSTGTSYTAYSNAMSAPKSKASAQGAKKSNNEQAKLRQPGRVKFDFTAQSAKELPARKGQTIVVTKRVNEDWYQAETADGKTSGIIPVQYVELISPSSSPEKPARNGQARAKFDFAGSTKVELSFKKGDDVILLKKIDANWYKGKVGASTGILPAVYVEVLVEPEIPETKVKSKLPEQLEAPKAKSPRSISATSSAPSSKHSYSLSQASSASSGDPDENDRKNRAAFLAHSVVDSGIQLHSKDSKKPIGEFDMTELDRVVESFSEPPAPVVQQQSITSRDGFDGLPSPPNQSLLTPSVPSYPSSNISSQPSTPRAGSPPPGSDFGQVIGRYIALYPYEAGNEDELDLIAGDVIMVVETCDDGWYVGTCQRTGAFGTFPGNYATLTTT